MDLRISRELIAATEAAARAAAPLECCGLLFGTTDADGAVVRALVPAANVAAAPDRHFEIDPAVLLAAHKAQRNGGASLLGHYHSHPAGTAAPSATDAAMAQGAGEVWLILGGDGTRGAWRADTRADGSAAFAPLRLVVPEAPNRANGPDKSCAPGHPGA